jgi:hypothetical protein
VTKPGISLERHAEIGAELAAIADRLVVLATEIRNAYPLASRVSRAAETFGSLTRHDHLLRLRSELEDAMFAQHAAGCGLFGPYPPGCSADVYWPDREDRKHVMIT